MNAVAAVGSSPEAEQDMAAGAAVHDSLWLPAHEFLLRHKLLADGIGVAFDFVGICAGAGLAFVALPVLGGSVAAVGLLGAASGAAAGAGSALLLAIDSAVFATEYWGDDVAAKRIEDNDLVQWTRIAATVMLMPDIAIGGVRALKEFGKLATEVRAGTAEVRADTTAAALRGRLNRPAKDFGSIHRREDRIKALLREAREQHIAVRRAQTRLLMLSACDINASLVASPGSAALLTGLPPAVIEGKAGVAADERLLDRLKPEAGMPNDIRVEARVSIVRRLARQ